jgi:hypothetical protein
MTDNERLRKILRKIASTGIAYFEAKALGGDWYGRLEREFQDAISNGIKEASIVVNSNG